MHVNIHPSPISHISFPCNKHPYHSVIYIPPAARAPCTYSTEESMETLKKIPLVRMRGKIIKGFGRGSKMLGVPTFDLHML